MAIDENTKVEARAGLLMAIRVITNDGADGKPNNESEAQIVELRKIMDPAGWGTGVPPKAAAQYRKACFALASLCEALGAEAISLRLSAEEYFGEDFSREPDDAIAPNPQDMRAEDAGCVCDYIQPDERPCVPCLARAGKLDENGPRTPEAAQ